MLRSRVSYRKHKVLARLSLRNYDVMRRSLSRGVIRLILDFIAWIVISEREREREREKIIMPELPVV